MNHDPHAPHTSRTVDGLPRRSATGLSWRSSLITIVLAALAAFLGARLGSQHPTASFRDLPLSERIFVLLEDQGNLDEQQRQTIRDIASRYAGTREQLQAQSRALNVRFARLMAEEQRFGPKTSQTLEELQLVMGERLKLSMEYMLEVRTALTPEQRAIFDRQVAEFASLSN